MASTVNSDLESISEWGSQNLVALNASKTKFLPVSLSSNPSDPQIWFNGNLIESLSSINSLGVQITSNLSWKAQIDQIAKSACRKLDVLFRCRIYFSSDQLLKIYIGLIRPCLEYCSHIWSGSSYACILDRIESKAFRLINDRNLTDPLDPLHLCCKVASLSFFYRYYFGHCYSQLKDWVPQPIPRFRCTLQAVASHDIV